MAGEKCPLCYGYIHRGEKTNVAPNGFVCHASCYAPIKDKVAADYEKKGLVAHIRRAFKAPEDYMTMTSEAKKIYESLLHEASGLTGKIKGS